MTWVEVLGHDIHYVEAGHGLPLVFLHGMSSCGEAWWQQFEAFASRYRVIAYDSVNHGHSSNSPRGEAEPDRTDELEAFLVALQIQRPILAGNSMGGATILRWAARHPSLARALVVSGAGVPAPGAPAFPAIAPLDADVLFLPVGDSLTEQLKKDRPRMFERYLRIRSTATRLEYMRAPRPRNPKTIEETGHLHDTIRHVTSRMLVILGSLDRVRPNAERLHALVPHSQLAMIDGAPHNVYWEAAEAWNRTVLEFLDRVV